MRERLYSPPLNLLLHSLFDGSARRVARRPFRRGVVCAFLADDSIHVGWCEDELAVIKRDLVRHAHALWEGALRIKVLQYLR